MRREFYFLSGLPRTGTTVLCSILSQNPIVYAGPNSPVCQLMWDAQASCQGLASEELRETNRADFQDEFVGNIPHLFYRATSRNVVVDRCKSWMLPANVSMIQRYITPDPKVIVMTRPLEEVIQSFVGLNRRNGVDITYDRQWHDHADRTIQTAAGVEWARGTRRPEYHFVEYADLIERPEETIRSIYEFCGWEPFVHHFADIACAHPANDSQYALQGLHEVRPRLGYRQEKVGAA